MFFKKLATEKGVLSMKKIMSFIASICIACSMFSSPCVSFAEDIPPDMITKLEAFLKEQGYDVRYNAHVWVPDEPFSREGEDPVYISLIDDPLEEGDEGDFDDEDFCQKLNDYCEKNQIDASLISIIVTIDAVEEIITEPETIKQVLTEFIKEHGYNASASVEGQSVIVTFGQQAADEEEYDAKAIDQKFRDYCIENQLDDSLVEVRFLADTAETLAEIMGDATGDGEIDILDVISLNKAVMGKESLTEAQLQAIDFNQNGKPDADEALTLLKYIVGLIEDFTAAEDIPPDMITKLEAFLKEQGYDVRYGAHVWVPDEPVSREESVCISLIDDALEEGDEEDFDNEDFWQKLKDYCEKNQIDVSLISIRVMI